MIPFSPSLQTKIDELKGKLDPVKIGAIEFSSPLLLAPMAGICTPPFRLLMQDLGAGGTVSELISCHGINHGNKRTLDMLKIHPQEKRVGIQLFGEDPQSMADSIPVVMENEPNFIDINMGCPVRKVVTKGGGSALLKDPKALGELFSQMKKVMNVPLSIKIRMGWDAEGINADEICHVAHEEGIEWVAIHGRTRAQQYTGTANWEYIESLVDQSKLPLIGNGDLHQAHQVRERLEKTKCAGLMIARGALRSPFIFLESATDKASPFNGSDFFEVIKRLYDYCDEVYSEGRIKLVQMRKLIVWFAAGFPGAASFRNMMFSCNDLEGSMRLAEDFYLSLGERKKHIDYGKAFMNSGHG